MDLRATILINQDGVIQGWNEGAEMLFGYARAEALGKTLDLIIFLFNTVNVTGRRSRRP